MEIKFKKSGDSSLIVVEEPSVKHSNYLEDFRKIVVNGQEFLKPEGSVHFKNCLFQKEHLEEIATQENCEYLVFSHICIEAKKPNEDPLKYSTTSVFGSAESEFLLKKDYHRGFFSIEFNATLTFPTNFDSNKNLQWHRDMDLDNCFWLKCLNASAGNSSFESWLNEFDAKRVVLMGVPDDVEEKDTLGKGIFFSKKKLEDLGIIGDTKNHKKIALFPVAIMTQTVDDDPVLLPTVTYVLAPIDENGKILEYTIGNTVSYPISYTTWPRNWDGVGGGIN